MSPRLDQELAVRGLVTSRTRAAREIEAGRVRVDGRVVTKPATKIAADAVLTLDEVDPWVARSAHKLLGALDSFGSVDPSGRVCLDAGASTGGFTQVLLERGAAEVFSVDVGHDQLSPVVVADPRVHDMPGRNLRDLEPAWLGERGSVDLVVADLSFISLTLVLDRLLAVTRPGGELLLMVKPQFELGRSALDKHGVVTDPRARARAVAGIAEAVAAAGARVVDWAPSVLPGPTGNREYFLRITVPGTGTVPTGSAPPGTVDPELLADIVDRIGGERA
ncbi:TlyA family RNA methyltransferase [Brevibacterium litoralis]|uniref:TlyA family RNA methyltransferase n=1 Tax=Brevibacterium litoralis TaxID=3138935 RepID=UPI0032EAA126